MTPPDSTPAQPAMTSATGAASSPIARRTLSILAGLAILILLVSLGIAQILLLAFAGLLLATLIRLVAHFFEYYCKFRHGWSVLAAVLAILGLATGGGWLAAPSLVEQFDILVDRLPRITEDLLAKMNSTTWGRLLKGLLPADDFASEKLLSRVTGVVSTTVGVVTSVVVVLFVGLFAAIDPGLYARGMVKLFPRQRQPRIRQVIAAVDHTLHWWIAGQAITMVVIGTLTGVGLWILGVPLALLLGVLAALLNFIPTFGPVIAFIPAALLALTQSPATFAYVLILWLIAQNLEGHVLTPLIQRRTVDLPPVLTILAQVIFATLFGVIGVVVAAPMTAVLLVIIKMLYVEDVLGNKVDIPAATATAKCEDKSIAAEPSSG